MKKPFILLVFLATSVCLFAQTGNSPFSQFGYNKHITYTSSKGEFEEFHDQEEVVEIGSVFFNTKTNKIVRYVSDEKDTSALSAATPALQIDPLCEKYYWITPYAYCANNPVKFVDPTGKEPVKKYSGTAAIFHSTLNNSPSKMGMMTGSGASAKLVSMGQIKRGFKPTPRNTEYFNRSPGRYLYTKKAGWLDMAHFMFYAGQAHGYKLNDEPHPAGKALKNGLLQEMADMAFAKHSAFSYEDLVSDQMGAYFGAYVFDPNSDSTMGEQIYNFLLFLESTDPKDAPNWDELPDDDSKKNPTHYNVFSRPKNLDGKEQSASERDYQELLQRLKNWGNEPKK